jgi:hypothetical protein
MRGLETVMPAGTNVRSGEGTGAGTSALLLHAVRGEGERVTVGQILDALDARAFGLATLIFSLPSVVPMPPGVPTVVGIALLIVSLQMVIGRHELWLPGFLTKRSFSRVALVRAFEKLAPRLEAVEKIAKPRLLFLTGKIGTVLIGLVGNGAGGAGRDHRPVRAGGLRGGHVRGIGRDRAVHPVLPGLPELAGKQPGALGTACDNKGRNRRIPATDAAQPWSQWKRTKT